MEKDLLVLEASSIVSGFRILNALPETHPVRLLDAEPIGANRFLILLKGASRDLADVVKIAKDDVVDHELIEDIQQTVLDATYSLTVVNLEESLLILETETAGSLLSLAQILVTQHKLKPIEIRIRKSGTGGAYGYFTGTAEACAPAAEDCRTRLRNAMREGAVEVLSSLNPHVRSLFASL